MRDTPQRRVLVIDSDVDSANSLADVLALHGHAVEVAYDAPAGIEKARAFPPDIVLCELDLPDGHCGCEVARTLRTEPTLAGSRLVLITGSSGGPRLARALRAGFDDYVLKPADLDALVHLASGEPACGCRRHTGDRHHFAVPLRERRRAKASAAAATSATVVEATNCC